MSTLHSVMLTIKSAPQLCSRVTSLNAQLLKYTATTCTKCGSEPRSVTGRPQQSGLCRLTSRYLLPAEKAKAGRLKSILQSAFMRDHVKLFAPQRTNERYDRRRRPHKTAANGSKSYSKLGDPQVPQGHRRQSFAGSQSLESNTSCFLRHPSTSSVVLNISHPQLTRRRPPLTEICAQRVRSSCIS